MKRTIAKLLLAFAVVAGCAARKDLQIHEGPKSELAEPVGLMPSVLLKDMPGAVAEGEEPFFAGVFVGNLVSSGGYYLEDTKGEGSPARSLHYDFNATEEYGALARDFVDRLVADELNRRGLSWTRLSPEAGSVPTPTRRTVRGSHPLDGTDNVNTPRYELEPLPLPGANALGAGYSSYLVPIIAIYYSHNGGWFIGQRMGCGGGARIRLLLVDYEAASGRTRGWRDVEARTIEGLINQPNGAQLQDFLIATEAKVRDEIHRHPLP